MSCPINKGVQCSGNGVCQSDGKCICNDGFTGIDCSLRTCPNDCSGNGECSQITGTCKCYPGYSGYKCDVFKGCPNDCNQRGKCINGICQCDFPYTGSECSIIDKSQNIFKIHILLYIISGIFALIFIFLIGYLFVNK